MKLLTTGATTTEIPEDPSRKASPAEKAANSACLQPVPVSDLDHIDYRFIPNLAKCKVVQGRLLQGRFVQVAS